MGLSHSGTSDDILGSAGAKLSTLVLVTGTRNGQEIVYDRADSFEDLQLSFLIWEVVRETVKIDFDAQRSQAGKQRTEK